MNVPKPRLFDPARRPDPKNFVMVPTDAYEDRRLRPRTRCPCLRDPSDVQGRSGGCSHLSRHR